MSEESKIEGTVNAVKGLVEAVPIYQDTVQPAAKEIGIALQTVAKSVHVLLAPVTALVWGYDQIKEFVTKRVAEKLKDVPEHQRCSPDPSIAGPTLEALRYVGHKDDLREMYASLLATAMDANTLAKAHPSFVEIIRQLSSDEAKMLKRLAEDEAFPLLDLRIEAMPPNRGGSWVFKQFSTLAYDVGCFAPELGPSYIGNLQRLGLIKIDENYHLGPIENGIDRYQPLLDHSFVAITLEKIRSSITLGKPVLVKGAAMMTPFGARFAEACIGPRET